MANNIQDKMQQAVVDLINKMFEIAGHDVTYDDIKDRKDAWYSEWTMSVEQGEEWFEWGVKYLQRNLNIDKQKAKKEMQYAFINWGLKFNGHNTL